jgi:hypothetical protein
MTDFRQSSMAERKQEEFHISEDAAGLGLRDVPVKRCG